MKITKKTAITGIAIIILIGIGSFFLEGAQSEDPSAGAKAETSAELVTDAADNGEKAAKEDAKSEDKEVKSESKSEKTSKSENNDKKSNTTSEKNTNSGNKNNNSNSGSSSSTSGSSSNTPSKPTHTHSWVAVYETVTETEYVGTRSICSTCGADVTGNTAAHAKEHAFKGENGGHYSKPIYEEVTKSVYSHDKCSCGATK